MLGVSIEAQPTEADKVKARRHDNLKLGWAWIRDQVDRGVLEYYQTGKFDRIEQVCESPVRESIKNHLEELRVQNIMWRMPSRQETQPQVAIVDEQLKGSETQRYVVRERFRDNSIYQRWDGDHIVGKEQAPGRDRVIEATVLVTKSGEYHLVSVVAIPEAGFDEV